MTKSTLWKMLEPHIGHNVEIVDYAGVNISLECETCGCVICDTDIYDVCAYEEAVYEEEE